MSFKQGNKTEDEFKLLIEKAGFTCTKSTKEQDMYKHYDFLINNKTKVDVKGLKKISRSDEEVQEQFHYVEIKNVSGNAGWLYGEADLFAFETFDYWVLVKKEDLKNFVAKNVKKIKVTDPKDALYKLYPRKDRKDIITLIKTIDLMAIQFLVLDKEKRYEKK